VLKTSGSGLGASSCFYKSGTETAGTEIRVFSDVTGVSKFK